MTTLPSQLMLFESFVGTLPISAPVIAVPNPVGLPSLELRRGDWVLSLQRTGGQFDTGSGWMVLLTGPGRQHAARLAEFPARLRQMTLQAFDALLPAGQDGVGVPLNMAAGYGTQIRFLPQPLRPAAANPRKARVRYLPSVVTPTVMPVGGPLLARQSAAACSAASVG